MEAVWRIYPHGGHRGECLTIGHIDYIWDTAHSNWRCHEEMGGHPCRLYTPDGDLHLNGQLSVGGKALFRQPTIFKRDVHIEGELVCRHLHGRDQGLFATLQQLHDACRSPHVGDWALVGDTAQPQLWNCRIAGTWEKVSDALELSQAFHLDAYRAARDIVDSIAAMGYVFCGFAEPTTIPHRPADHNVFYLTTTPGEYVHFGGLHVRHFTLLMWTHDADADGNGHSEGMWTARVLLGGEFVYEENIADDAVSLEKLTPGVRSIFTNLEAAITAETQNRETADRDLQRDVADLKSTTVRSVSLNDGARIRPDAAGNVRLVIRTGEGGEPEDLSEIYQRLDGLDTDLQSLETTLDGLAADIRNLNTSVSDLSASIADLDTRVTALENKPDPTPEPEPEPDFDPYEGNHGSIVIDKAVEDITPEDIRNADILDELPYTEANVFTAAAIGLTPSSTYDDNIAAANTAKLNAALANDDCTVIDLGHNLFPLKTEWIQGWITNADNYVNRANNYYRSIDLKHDLRIQAETDENGDPDGGFITGYSNLFYTDHSLELVNVRFIRSRQADGFLVMVDTRPGIDHVIVRNCQFDYTSDTKVGATFFFYRPDEAALSDEGNMITDTNCIGNILFEHNRSNGQLARSQNLFVAHTWRYLDNTIENVRAAAIDHGTNNEQTYSNEAAFVSCPLYVAGNKFIGHRENQPLVIHRKFTSGSYLAATLAEAARLYFLRNEVTDLVSAYSAERGAAQVTYDLYFQGREVYSVKNTIRNLARIAVADMSYFGTLKGKGTATPAKYSGHAIPMLRYYTHNDYSCDVDEIKAAWEAQDYSGEYGQQNADYDNTTLLNDNDQFNLEDWLYLQLGQFDGGSATLATDAKLVFSHNTVNYPVLSGMPLASAWTVNNAEVIGNRFNCKRVSSDQFTPLPRKKKEQESAQPAYDTYLFVFRHLLSLKFNDNIFTATAAEVGAQTLNIEAALHKYSSSLSEPTTIGTLETKGNILIDPAATITIKCFNVATWSNKTAIYTGRGDEQ